MRAGLTDMQRLPVFGLAVVGGREPRTAGALDVEDLGVDALVHVGEEAAVRMLEQHATGGRSSGDVAKVGGDSELRFGHVSVAWRGRDQLHGPTRTRRSADRHRPNGRLPRQHDILPDEAQVSHRSCLSDTAEVLVQCASKDVIGVVGDVDRSDRVREERHARMELRGIDLAEELHGNGR